MSAAPRPRPRWASRVWRCLTSPQWATTGDGPRTSSAQPATSAPSMARTRRDRRGSRPRTSSSSTGATSSACTGGKGKPAAPPAFVTSTQQSTSCRRMPGVTSPARESWPSAGGLMALPSLPLSARRYRGGVVVDDAHVVAFTSLRPLLFSVAYRLLGEASGAEDVVQEAWLRYAPRASHVADPRAWLLTVVARLSLVE